MTLRPVAGFLVWTAAFGLLYATLSVGCAFGLPAGTLRPVLLVIAAAAVAAGAVLLLRPWGPVARLSSAAALAASILTFLPVVGLSLCD